MVGPLDMNNLVRIKEGGSQEYWERESTVGGVLLIPVVNGVPRVAEFIHVAADQIVRVTDTSKAPGYGRGSLLTWAAQ